MEDHDFILELATSSASLDKSPKKNWVENAGGLPPYVRKLARAIAKRGHSLDSAIAIAISRVKAWAAGGGDVDADTRAKAVKALAQWEAAKAKNKIKLSAEEGGDYLTLSSPSFNTEIVRTAWNALEGQRRRLYDGEYPAATRGQLIESSYPYRWVRELGNDYIIVETESSTGPDYFKIPYSVVDGEDVYFGEESPIRQEWVKDDDDGPLSLSESRALADVLVTLSNTSPLDRIARAAKNLS